MKKLTLLFTVLLILPTSAFASTAKLLVIGGGGEGGRVNGGGGGGGAASVEYDAAFTISAKTYTITIGAGGAGGTTVQNGSNSVFGDGTASTTSIGGGKGASGDDNDAGSGGSGGGAAYDRAGAAAGSGANVHGGGTAPASSPYPGGGGGGAVAAGANASGGAAGNGGDGVADAAVGNLLSLTTSGVDVGGTRYIAGGGGGGVGAGGTGSSGGKGGGGGGGVGSAGTAGTANTGSGGGGQGNSGNNQGAGGSGIVILEYTTGDFGGFTYSGSYSSGTDGSYTWIKMTTSGTLTITAAGGGGVATTTLQYLTFTSDALGNITKVVDTSGGNGYGTTDFVYDNLSRLTSASSTLTTLGNWLETFTYDTLGNLTNKSDLGNYTYSGTGFTNPHAATTIGGTNYTYDNAGNLLTAGNGTATTSNTWNYRNRLTDTNDGKGSSATTTHYAYDESDQRVEMDTKRGSQATTTRKTWNPYYETETDGTNSTTTINILLPDGTLLATVEGNGTATTTSVIHTDHLGGTNVVSNETGSQRQLNNYYPYGAKRIDEKPSNNSPQTRQFIGQPYDAETQLSYLQNRYYSGGNGKFLSQDPVARDIGMMGKMPAYLLYVNQAQGTIDQTLLLSNPQMLNSYSYSINNPINISDPSGKNPFLIAGGAAFVGSVTWNLGNDFYQNYQDVRSGSLPWYMITQGRGANPGARYFRDASEAAAVAVGAVGAEMAAPVLMPGITLGGAQVIGASTAGLGNVGVSFLNGTARDSSTGRINTPGLVTDFAAGFVGTRIGQQIPNPAGRPPTTVTGSLGGARAATEQLRVQLGQLVQALTAYVATLSTQKTTK